MEKSESPETIIEYAKKGRATRDEINGVLEQFCSQARLLKFPESPISMPVLEFVLSAVEGFLHGKNKSIEHGLGLKNKGIVCEYLFLGITNLDIKIIEIKKISLKRGSFFAYIPTFFQILLQAPIMLKASI